MRSCTKQQMRSRFSGAVRHAGCYREAAGEAAVVVGDELRSTALAESRSWAWASRSSLVSDLAAHPEPLDAAFGLRAVGSHEGDAELLQGAAELRGWRLPASCSSTVQWSSLRTKTPRGRHTKRVAHRTGRPSAEASRDSRKWFPRERMRRQDFAGGVVLHAQSVSSGRGLRASRADCRRAARVSELGGTQSALTMRGSTALSRGAEAVLAQQAAKGLGD